MFSRGSSLLSRPQRQHFRKKIPGFYSPYYGASFMKFYPVIPYKQRSGSLFHYPDVSEVTGKKINWMYDKPTSGYEGLGVYGEHTIEIRGLPMGKTPEYMQERLRRYFSKYGPVVACRALSHSLDPYQCEGTAYVSFRQESACEASIESVIQLGPDLGNRVLSVRHLASDTVRDGKAIIVGWRESRDEILAATRAVYVQLVSRPAGESIESLRLTPKQQKAVESEFTSILGWMESLTNLFIANESKIFFARRLADCEKELVELGQRLDRKMDDRVSVHWRVNAPVKQLPEYTNRRVKLWDKKDKLPFDLEVLSRDFRQHRVHDEKFLIASRAKRDRKRVSRAKQAEAIS